MQNCLFCNLAITNFHLANMPHLYRFSCDNCGDYLITDKSLITLRDLSTKDKTCTASYLQSRHLTEKSPIVLTDKKPAQKDFNGIPFITVDEILSQLPKRVNEKLSRALQNLGKLSKERIGTIITVYFDQHAILYALDKTELTGILDALKDDGYIKYSEDINPAYIIEVTAKGFKYIYELDKLDETKQSTIVTKTAPSIKQISEYDAFICHASEDKKEVADPLAKSLTEKGLKVWYDDFSLKIGDSLRESIDRGLLNSKYGVVIFSPNFFKKKFPQTELNGLFAKEYDGCKVILPIWHKITRGEIINHSPLIADKIAAETSDGLDVVVEKIIEVVNPQQG